MYSIIEDPQSICILRLSAIGDVCHAVASVQAIQERWPQTNVTWVIGKVEYQLLKGLPGVSFVIFDKKAGLQGYKDLKAELKDQKFDVLLHMQVAFRASLATLCIKADTILGFDKVRAKEAQWLFSNQKIDPQIEPHVAEGFLGFAKALGVAKEHQLSWNMPIEQSDIDWQRENLSRHGRYIVISPSASKAERNWLPERYAAIANHANDKGLSVVICGGPTAMETELAKKIESNCHFKPVNLVGKTSLKQLLVVLKEAVMVLAPDSGPAHMAVTVATPVIGLYVHSNPKRTGPYIDADSKSIVISCYEDLLEKQTGKPVDKNLWGKRVKGSELMSLIEVEPVMAAFDKICLT
jgi:heptosyltransferase I